MTDKPATKWIAVKGDPRLIAKAPEMAQLLTDVLGKLRDYSDEHDGRYAIGPEIQARIDAILCELEDE